MSISTVGIQLRPTNCAHYSCFQLFPAELWPKINDCIQVEFAVQMAGSNSGTELREALKNVGTVEIDEKAGRVVINSHVPWVEIQEKIENTGRRAVLSGFGGS